MVRKACEAVVGTAAFVLREDARHCDRARGSFQDGTTLAVVGLMEAVWKDGFGDAPLDMLRVLLSVSTRRFFFLEGTHCLLLFFSEVFVASAEDRHRLTPCGLHSTLAIWTLVPKKPCW